MQNTSWLRIARDYPDNGSGPTFPFIIGAIRDPIGSARTPKEDRDELHSLLLAMNAGAPHRSTVTIRLCSGLREYIAEIYPAPMPTKFNSGFASSAKPLDWRIDGQDVPDLEALESFLWERYEGPLAKQRFSYDDHIREWREFSSAERATIQATLNG